MNENPYSSPPEREPDSSTRDDDPIRRPWTKRERVDHFLDEILTGHGCFLIVVMHLVAAALLWYWDLWG